MQKVLIYVILLNSKKFSDDCPFNGSLSRTTTPFSLGEKNWKRAHRRRGVYEREKDREIHM